MLIATKNVLKLLQNNNVQLSLDTTHGLTWNRWPLHACGVVDVNHHFHPVACVFTSNETTMSYEFLLETILQLRYKTHGRDDPDVECTINDDSDAMFAAVEKNFPDA